MKPIRPSLEAAQKPIRLQEVPRRQRNSGCRGVHQGVRGRKIPNLFTWKLREIMPVRNPPVINLRQRERRIVQAWHVCTPSQQIISSNSLFYVDRFSNLLKVLARAQRQLYGAYVKRAREVTWTCKVCRFREVGSWQKMCWDACFYISFPYSSSLS